MEKKAVVIENYKGGLNDSRDSYLIDESQSSSLQNVDIDKAPAIMKSKGSLLISTLTAGTRVKHSYLFIKSDGTKIALYVVNIDSTKDRIYTTTDFVTWTALPRSDDPTEWNPNYDIEFETYRDATPADRLWITNGYNSVQNWDGSAGASSLVTFTGAGAVQLTPRYLKIHGERMFWAQDDDYPGSMFPSTVGNPVDVPILNQIPIRERDGYPLTGIMPFQGNMVAFKENSITVMSGDIITGSLTPTYTLQTVVTGVGTIYNRSIQFYNNIKEGLYNDVLIFMGKTGIFAFDGAKTIRIMDNISEIFKNIALPDISPVTWEGTTEWDAGTIGDELLDSSGEVLKQLPQTDKADFEAGTGTNVDTTTSEGDVQLDRTTGDYITQLLYGTMFDNNQYTSTAVRIAQSFTPAVGISLTSISLYLKRTGSATYNFYVDIRPDDGGEPHAITVISSRESVATGAISLYGGWVTFTFDSPVILTGATKYWIVTYMDGGTYWDGVSYGYKNNVYAGGNKAVSFNSGYNYGQSTDDMSFKITGYYFDASGNLISQSIDFGAIPTSLGNLSAEITVPASTTLLFQTRTSDDDIDWSDAWQDIGTAGENNGAINSTERRYIQWKALFVASNTASTPILSSVYIGGQYITATKDLGSIPSSWGQMIAEQTLNGQTISYEIDTSVDGTTWDGWVSVGVNSVPPATVRRYIRYRITFNTTLYSSIPVLTSLTQYYGVVVSSSVASINYDNRYYLSVPLVPSTYNNMILVLNTDRVWTIRKGVNIGTFLFYNNSLYIGDSNDKLVYIYGTNDNYNGSAIESWYDTKNFDFGESDRQKMARYLYVECKKMQSDYNMQIGYSIDEGDWTYFDVNLNGTGILKDRLEFAGGSIGTRFKFRIRNMNANEPFEFYKMQFYYVLLNRRNV